MNKKKNEVHDHHNFFCHFWIFLASKLDLRFLYVFFFVSHFFLCCIWSTLRPHLSMSDAVRTALRPVAVLCHSALLPSLPACLSHPLAAPILAIPPRWDVSPLPNLPVFSGKPISLKTSQVGSVTQNAPPLAKAKLRCCSFARTSPIWCIPHRASTRDKGTPRVKHKVVVSPTPPNRKRMISFKSLGQRGRGGTHEQEETKIGSINILF